MKLLSPNAGAWFRERRSLLPLLSLLLLLPLGQTRATADLIAFWSSSGTYGHALLLFPVILYLLVRDWPDLVTGTGRVSIWGLFSFLALLFLLWAGQAIHLLTLSRIALVLLLPAAFWALHGHRALLRASGPLLLLLLVIPLWGPLQGGLQMLTAWVAHALLQWMGIPVYLENHYLTIPSGRFDVEEACAGLRYLLAALSIGALYALLGTGNRRRRLLILLVFMLTAVLLNWVRVVIVVLVGHLSQMTAPLVSDHRDFGWYLFAGSLFPVIWLVQRFLLVGEEGISAREHRETPSKPGRSQIVMGLLLALLVVGGGRLPLAGGGQTVAVFTTLPPGYVVLQDPAPSWQPVFIGADRELRARPSRTDEDRICYLALYRHERQGKELINDLNHFVGGEGWRILEQQRVEVEGEEGLSGTVGRDLVEGEGRRWIMWHWYVVAGRVVANRYLAKLLQLQALLYGPNWSVAAAVLEAPETTRGTPPMDWIRYSAKGGRHTK